jgi:hypothetical protein
MRQSLKAQHQALHAQRQALHDKMEAMRAQNPPQLPGGRPAFLGAPGSAPVGGPNNQPPPNGTTTTTGARPLPFAPASN